MLSKAQQKYLQTLPKDLIVEIYPYHSRLKEAADKVIKKVHLVSPDLEVLFMGAAGLGISGQGDIDLYALCPADDFDGYLPGLIEQFGEPKSRGGTSIAWEFWNEDGCLVQLYLTDPESPEMKEQIKVFEVLKNNPQLLKEYEQLKEDGLPLREYQKRKYEFYNRILEK